jgi:multidrug efflux system outer membrane protein
MKRLTHCTRVLALASLTLALAGCSLAPTYERPAAPVPSTFPNLNVGDPPASVLEANLPEWQSFFQDPRLKALIELALENNRDLRIAVQRVQEARAQYGIVRSDQLPAVGVGGTAQITRTPENLRPGSGDSSSVSRV